MTSAPKKCGNCWPAPARSGYCQNAARQLPIRARTSCSLPIWPRGSNRFRTCSRRLTDPCGKWRSKRGLSKRKRVSRGLLGAQDGALYDLPAGPLGLNAATVGWTLFGVGANRVLALELSALEADGRGRILSSPRVVTADRVKALVEQGTELPYQAKVGTGVSGVQFRRAGLKLEVTPNITPDGHVMLDVDITKDSVGAQPISGPAINTKHVQTQVQVEDGGTVSIGGIFMQDERVDVTGVPWLRQLPLIGALFRHSKRARNKSELLVFITPNIVAKNP